MDVNKLQESVNNLREFQEKLEKAAENTQDVKDKISTPEEEKQEPSYVLYNQIAEGCIQILQLPTSVKAFDEIADKLGEETAQHLCEMLAVAMTHSAYSAIVFYDELLKKELGDQFQHFADVLNDTIGSVNGHEGALQVFKEKIGNIEKQLKINSILNEK